MLKRDSRHDATLDLPHPYQATPANPNDYRCFVLDPHVDRPAIVTGYEFRPDQVEIVHHALVYRLPACEKQAVENAKSADPTPRMAVLWRDQRRGHLTVADR